MSGPQSVNWYLRVALARADADVARREHAHLQAVDVGKLAAHAVDHATRGDAAALG